MKIVKLPKGKYIVAVSGGVDSVAVLDLLCRQPDLELVVAHVNHGIRADAGEDQKLTHLLSKSHNLEFLTTDLKLGSKTSEDTARQARYAFLQHCRISENAVAIVTAHHKDDLIETVLINLLRGTGWRGLVPFNQPHIVRPLLEVSKKELLAYAKLQKLVWREDSTNANQDYLRNYVRHSLIPKLDKQNTEWQESILRLIRKQTGLRHEIETETQQWLKEHLAGEGNQVTIDRHQLIMLPSREAYELLQQICRVQLGHSLVKKLAEQVLLFAKTARPGKQMPLGADGKVRVTTRSLIVEVSPVMLS